MVGADRMAALDICVIIDAISIFHQSRGIFARVAGVDAVVLGRKIEEGRRICHALADIVIGRIFRQEGPIPGHVGVAIFGDPRSEEHTSELQSLMRISYAVFCLKKKHITISAHYRYYTQYNK